MHSYLRPRGPSVHGGVRDEDGRVCLGKRKEEEELVVIKLAESIAVDKFDDHIYRYH